MVYGNRTTEAQSAQRTNERRRLLLRSKYAILFKYCNKDEFHVSANSASLRLIIVAEKPTLAVYGNKTTESQSAQRTTAFEVSREKRGLSVSANCAFNLELGKHEAVPGGIGE